MMGNATINYVMGHTVFWLKNNLKIQGRGISLLIMCIPKTLVSLDFLSLFLTKVTSSIALSSPLKLLAP